MPIQTINGTEFYNYRMKDARIADKDVGSISNTHKKYASIRQRTAKGKLHRLGKFLYNKEHRTSCNRTGRHWGALTFYFLCFLGIMMLVFLCYFYGINRLMTNNNKPVEEKFYMSEVPTFTFVPLKVNTYPDPIIWYKMHGADSEANRRAAPYVNEIRTFYRTQATNCAKRNMPECIVDPSFYGPCGAGTFGYEDQKPCLMIKLNVKAGWHPDAYHSMFRVPASMPKELKDKLDVHKETVCIHCEGEALFDQTKIGKLKYYPEACYNDTMFPFQQGPSNVNPTLAVQLTHLKPGYIVELTCRLFGLAADGTGEHRQSVFIYVGQK